MHFIDLIKQPWPWYVAGPLIGLTVPLLLLLGNKSFGISSSLRHICAACMPANIPFFQYQWKKEIWNLFFAAGILLGSFIAASLLNNHQPVLINPKLVSELQVVAAAQRVEPRDVVIGISGVAHIPRRHLVE